MSRESSSRKLPNDQDNWILVVKSVCGIHVKIVVVYRWLVGTVEQQVGPTNYLVNVEGHSRYVHIDQMRWRDQRSVPETADVSVPEIEVEEISVPVIPVKETETSS